MSGEALHTGLALSGCLLALFLAEAFALIATSGSGSRRRDHFWARVMMVGLTMPGLLMVLVLAGRLGLVSGQLAAGLSSLVVLICIPAMMLVPALLFDYSGPASGDDGDGGGGSSPESPPPSDTPPRGDLPLPGAETGRWRVRDHVRPVPGHDRVRRPARHPARAPVRPGTRPRAVARPSRDPAERGSPPIPGGAGRSLARGGVGAQPVQIAHDEAQPAGLDQTQLTECPQRPGR